MLQVLARLADSASESEEVDIELNNIRKALEVQSEGDFQLEELLMKGTSQNLRPTLLRFGPDVSRQLSDCNSTEHFIAAFPAIPFIERVGRRKVMTAVSCANGNNQSSWLMCAASPRVFLA